MNEVDVVRENLNIILKHGDLFDVICLKEGVKPLDNSFIKLNILFLSRILFSGVLVWEKLKSYFAPVEKVRKAQEQIRIILGVNVDIISFKRILNVMPFKKDKNVDNALSILYEEDKVNLDDYISNLQKILTFVEIYDINEVLLRKSDITNSFVDINLDEFSTDNLRSVLGGFLEENLNEELLSLTPNKLLRLINILVKCKSDKKFIKDIGSRINDLVVSRALDDFYQNGDVQKLKNIVLNRLTLIINSENVKLEKQNGKVFETITIIQDYVKVLSSNQDGKIISNIVMSLYDYLEVVNFQDLLLKIDKPSDNEEILLMSALYLYLCETKETSNYKRENTISFYDRIYGRFKAKKNRKIKSIKGIYSKSYKFSQNCKRLYSSMVLTAVLVIGICLAGWSADFINTFLLKNGDLNIFENMFETIVLPYKYSWKFEKQFIDETIGIADAAIAGFCDSISSLTGDSYNIDNNIVVAKVTPINDYSILPTYYATGYADSATYFKGQMNYNIVNPELDVYEIQNVDSLFKVTYNVGKQNIRDYIDDFQINISPLLYPLGDNYVLTKIVIWDGNDNSRYFVIDYERMISVGNIITEDERNYLTSIRDPKITCYYGISQQNSFVESLEKDSPYTSLEYSEVIAAITSGLNLREDASLEEILEAIKSKSYSTTPIKDAGLTSKIKKLDEKEYIETIASLDSLICNLAATLAVEADQELIYVVGFMDDGNALLQGKESHAWAINSNGEIIDVTPSTAIIDEEIDNVIKEIFIWGLQSGISIFTIIYVANLIVKKLFGHNIIFTIEYLKLNKLLNTADIEEAYAMIKEVWYGGINIPKKSTPYEYINKIDKEFASFSKEELKELKKLLSEKRLENKELYDNAIRLVEKVPFIRKNVSELRRILERK